MRDPIASVLAAHPAVQSVRFERFGGRWQAQVWRYDAERWEHGSADTPMEALMQALDGAAVGAAYAPTYPDFRTKNTRNAAADWWGALRALNTTFRNLGV